MLSPLSSGCLSLPPCIPHSLVSRSPLGCGSCTRHFSIMPHSSSFFDPGFRICWPCTIHTSSVWFRMPGRSGTLHSFLTRRSFPSSSRTSFFRILLEDVLAFLDLACRSVFVDPPLLRMPEFLHYSASFLTPRECRSSHRMFCLSCINAPSFVDSPFGRLHYGTSLAHPSTSHLLLRVLLCAFFSFSSFFPILLEDVLALQWMHPHSWILHCQRCLGLCTTLHFLPFPSFFDPPIGCFAFLLAFIAPSLVW